ncbi:hypothetical protein FB451DRAFT_1427791 [Mycena latifolia]|nr:hypothetical protein FB451DRAFT_1427791 [Mycena latifolia]
MNNGPLLHYLGGQDSDVDRPVPRRRVSSNPCLPERLPTTSKWQHRTRFLQREAEIVAPKAILRQLRRSPTPSPPNSPEPDAEVEENPVLRAVERKDIMYLMEIRDRSFHLLVRMSGGITPLLHAMRLGQSHRDVAVILLGAFSRWVNHVEDDQMENPRTKMVLKALRANLKLAIDYGLTKTQGSDLTASFLQTLIMSQGESWVRGQAGNVGLALRAGTEGRPVQTADAAVRKFATRELGKADLIATLADYIANATADLLMMGAWSLASEVLQLDQIPTYYFARDDRVYKAFVERLDEHKNAIQFKLTKRLKWQLRILRTVLEGRTITYRSKIELLAGELDEGEGV